MPRVFTYVSLLTILVPLLVVSFAPATATAGNPPFVSVVVLLKERPTPEDVSLIVSNAGQITRTYTIINGFAATIPEGRLANIKSSRRVISVDLDVAFRALDLSADRQIRADQVWNTGDAGQGVPVAILDTGIDTSHPEFSGRIQLCHSEITATNTCEDQNGHGTHVAGIVGATGILDTAKGVGPTVSYYVDQVLDSHGSGSLSGVIAGIDWATSNGAKVISMSLGTNPISTTQPNCDTAIPSLTTAVNNAVAAGVSVVAAAGNEGAQGVDAPACISSSIAVGAVDSTDTIASFSPYYSSSRGAPMADHGIVAPGVSIYSTYLNDGYTTLSGTSMATPHVSGTIALMLKANPGLTPTQVRNTLFSTTCTQSTSPTCPTGAVPNTVYGYGRVDALRAYSAVSSDFSLSASPSSLSIKKGSSGTSTITVTPSNGFSSPVSLTVACPQGVTCTLSASSVMPSDGSATSSLTIAVSTTAPSRTYTITITGTSGSLTHTTTINLKIGKN